MTYASARAETQSYWSRGLVDARCGRQPPQSDTFPTVADWLDYRSGYVSGSQATI